VSYAAELGYWVVSRYDDCLQILRDHRRFSASNTLAPVLTRCAHAARALAEGGFRSVPTLTNVDPPAHTRTRRIAHLAFTPRRVAAMEQFVRGVVQRVVAERLTDGRADLVAALTYELPASVLFHIMGVPLEDLGAPLARLEARVVLEELASAVPSLRLLPDQTYEFMPIIAFRGPRSLHVSRDRRG